MATNNNGSVIVDTCNRRIIAIDEHVPAKAEIGVDGEKLKKQGVRDIYQRCVDARTSLATRRAEVKAAMAERDDADRSRRKADRAMRGWVTGQFGEDSEQAHAFGFPPRKRAVKTVETKYGAVLQARETRKARHTMGKKQKQNLIGVVVLPAPGETPAAHPAQTPAVAPPTTPATPPPADKPNTPAPTTNGHVPGASIG